MNADRCMRAAVVLCVGVFVAVGYAEERTERFDKDPGWDGRNNRVVNPRDIVQDFGYSLTKHTSDVAGEMGGFVSGAAEPAYYAKKLESKSFDDVLSASGTLTCDGRPVHALIGFFYAGTLNEWRTPNTIAIRISGRGDVFYAWLEYCSSRWRAGGDDPQGFPITEDPLTGRKQFKGFAARGKVHKWSLTYDPKANGGRGAITATIGDERAICHVNAGHRADGATFNRFGQLNAMKHADGGGGLWLNHITINGVKEDFTKEPAWEGFQNRRRYVSRDVRPSFDFGYSPTRHAGGIKQGEIGGLVFRGDCRFERTLAYCGDRLQELSLAKPMKASGRVSLKRGVSDSTTLLGFFHSTESVRVNPSQDSGIPANFLGVAVEGPSREGFLFYPMYRVAGDGGGYARGDDLPHILPDGSSHDWTLEYDPTAADGRGRITVSLGGKKTSVDLESGHKASGARFDRFGIVTTWIDGNGQQVFFDDLTYTCKQ